MTGRWRSLALLSALILGLGGVTAFASRHRSEPAATSGPTGTDGSADRSTGRDEAASATSPTSFADGVPAPAGSDPTSAVAAVAAPPTSAGGTAAAPASTTTTGRATSSTAKPAATGAAATAAARPAGGSAPLAGRIKPGVTYQGVATFYGADGGGACLYDHPSGDLMVAAMNHTDYETSRACGARVQVRSASGTTISVRIVDECPECAVGQLDLSREAFARLADPTLGRIPITWTLLSPDLGPLSIRYKAGSSRYWCGIQVIDHRNPVARLEVSVNGTFKALERTSYNYFLSPDGSGCGSSIRITDIYGESVTVPALPVRPDATQKTAVQFSRH